MSRALDKTGGHNEVTPYPLSPNASEKQMGYVEQAPSPFVPDGVVPVNVGGVPGAMPMGPGSVGGGTPIAITRVYVGNLSWETEWQDLKDHMRSAGEVCVCAVVCT